MSFKEFVALDEKFPQMLYVSNNVPPNLLNANTNRTFCTLSPHSKYRIPLPNIPLDETGGWTEEQCLQTSGKKKSWTRKRRKRQRRRNMSTNRRNRFGAGLGGL